MGGIYLYDDGRDTADNINLHRGVSRETERDLRSHHHGHDRRRSRADIVFMGTGGRLSIFRYGYHFIPAKECSRGRDRRRHSDGRYAHGQLAGMHAHAPAAQRRRGVGTLLGVACHIGNIAYQTDGRTSGSAVAGRSGRSYEHLNRRQHGIHPLAGQAFRRGSGARGAAGLSLTWSRWCTTGANC